MVHKMLKVCLVGAGSMGGALCAGWVEAGILAKGSLVIDPMPSDDVQKIINDGLLHCVGDASAVEGTPAFDVLVLAIKPQLSSSILPALTSRLSTNAVLSVMAGVSTAEISAVFGKDMAVLRAMPNLPVKFKSGVTGLYAAGGISASVLNSVTQLFEIVGTCVSVESEEALDLVTAISGSGPAYFFLMTELLAKAGEKLGMPTQAAHQLARQTLIGAGVMMDHDTRSARELREAVTSPKGTTDAALFKLNTHQTEGLTALMDEAVKAAFQRAQELSNPSDQ